MATADHTVMVNSLNGSSVFKGVSAGFTPPAGGGTYVYGMSSKVNTPGAVGLYTNLGNFSPMAKGGIVSCALQKLGGGGGDSHAPMIYLCAQGTDVNDLAYLLGLSDEDPARIILRKGAPVNGLPDNPVGTTGVLARSTNTYSTGEWVHLQLEVVVNSSGDVVVNVYENDLSTNDVDSPSWTAIAGMKDTPGGVEATAFIDDSLAVNSGTDPLTSGRGGFAGHFTDISRTLLFDHLVLERDTS